MYLHFHSDIRELILHIVFRFKTRMWCIPPTAKFTILNLGFRYLTNQGRNALSHERITPTLALHCSFFCVQVSANPTRKSALKQVHNLLWYLLRVKNTTFHRSNLANGSTAVLIGPKRSIPISVFVFCGREGRLPIMQCALGAECPCICEPLRSALT